MGRKKSTLVLRLRRLLAGANEGLACPRKQATKSAPLLTRRVLKAYTELNPHLSYRELKATNLDRPS